MLEYPVIAIRAQTLTPKQQATFSRQLGPLESQDRTTYTHPDDPDILILSNEIWPDGTAVGIVDAGDFWHSDSSHHEEPCNRTVLYAVRNPSRGAAPPNSATCTKSTTRSRRTSAGVEVATASIISARSRIRASPSAARTDAKDYYKQHEKVTKEVLQPIVRTIRDGSPGALHLAALHHRHCRHAGFESAAVARQALRRHDGTSDSITGISGGSGSGDLG
jgi:alpha-ketoglutarate-dependent taurine dioxygenase